MTMDFRAEYGLLPKPIKRCPTCNVAIWKTANACRVHNSRRKYHREYYSQNIEVRRAAAVRSNRRRSGARFVLRWIKLLSRAIDQGRA